MGSAEHTKPSLPLVQCTLPQTANPLTPLFINQPNPPALLAQVEDIVDTGRTAVALTQHYKQVRGGSDVASGRVEGSTLLWSMAEPLNRWLHCMLCCTSCLPSYLVPCKAAHQIASSNLKRCRC